MCACLNIWAKYTGRERENKTYYKKLAHMIDYRGW